MILLDTPSLIWWVNRHADLSAPALGHIEAQRPGGIILISTITAWDIADLAQHGKLGLRMEPAAWFTLIAAIPEIQIIPITTEIALQAATLPAPAPPELPLRLLIATARHHGCPLITNNQIVKQYQHIKTIW